MASHERLVEPFSSASPSGLHHTRLQGRSVTISVHDHRPTPFEWLRLRLCATTRSLMCDRAQGPIGPRCRCGQRWSARHHFKIRDRIIFLCDETVHLAPSFAGEALCIRDHLLTHPAQTKQPPPGTSSTTSGHLRPTSTSIYAQSTGPGSRAPTSMAGNFGQSVNGRQRANTSRARPATAMGNRGPESDASAGSQCMNSPLNFRYSGSCISASSGVLRNKKLRGSASMSSFVPISSTPTTQEESSRQSSLSSLVSRVGHMSINEKEADDGVTRMNRAQVNSICDGKPAPRADHRPGPRPSNSTVGPGGGRENAAGQ